MLVTKSSPPSGGGSEKKSVADRILKPMNGVKRKLLFEPFYLYVVECDVPFHSPLAKHEDALVELYLFDPSYQSTNTLVL
jgi:hypothetical protein